MSHHEHCARGSPLEPGHMERSMESRDEECVDMIKSSHTLFVRGTCCDDSLELESAAKTRWMLLARIISGTRVPLGARLMIQLAAMTRPRSWAFRTARSEVSEAPGVSALSGGSQAHKRSSSVSSNSSSVEFPLSEGKDEGRRQAFQMSEHPRSESRRFSKCSRSVH